MAKRIEILIQAKNQVAAGVGAASRSLKSLNKIGGAVASAVAASLKAVAGASAAAVAAGTKLLKLWDKQSAAERNLATVHKLYGDSVARSVASEKRLASAIQDEIGKGDEATLSLMARLRMLGVAPAAMERATRATYALAAAGLDESSAARAVSMALGGNFTMLQRLSPEIRNAKTETEKLAAFNKLCAAGYEQLKDNMATFSGQLAALKGRLGDLGEQAGRVLASDGKVNGWLGRASNWVKSKKDELTFVADSLEDPLAKLDGRIMELERLTKTTAGRNEVYAKQDTGRWYDSASTRAAKAAKDAARAQEELLALERELAEAQKRRAQIIEERRQKSREEAEQNRRDAEEDARAYAKVGEIYDRLIAAKRQYAEIHAYNQDLEAARKTLADLLDVQREMNEKTKEETRELEKQRGVVAAQIEQERQKLEAFKKQKDALREAAKERLKGLNDRFGGGFNKFKGAKDEEKAAEKEAKRQQRRDDKALRDALRLEAMIKSGQRTGPLTKSEQRKLEYLRGRRELEAAKRLNAQVNAGQGNAMAQAIAQGNIMANNIAQGVAQGEADAVKALEKLEERQKELTRAIELNNAKDFNAEEIKQVEATIRQIESAMREMPSAGDVKSLVGELENALREAKTSSNEWQKNLADNEAALIQKAEESGISLKEIEGILRGQSAYLQKSLESI